MRLLRAVAGSARGRLVLAALAAYVAWQAWLGAAAPGKLAADLAAGGDKVNVLVTLPFTPERFHVVALQRWGRVSGTEDSQIELRGVKRADLTALARPYWVRRVEPLPPGR
jgi:hypothetical protein